MEKARKALPTATILKKIFEFSEIYVCQKYKISVDSVCNLNNEYSVNSPNDFLQSLLESQLQL